MSSFMQLLPAILQMQAQSRHQQRPTQMPGIMSAWMADKRAKQELSTRQQMQEQELASKESLAGQEMASKEDMLQQELFSREGIAGQSASLEASKIDAAKKEALLRAYSQIQASGNDTPPDLEAAIRGAGILNVGGELPRNIGPSGPYIPPNSNDFETQLLLAKNPDEVRKIIADNPNVSPNKKRFAAQRINALESGVRSGEIPFTQDQLDAVKSGNVAGLPPKIVSAVQEALMRDDLISGKKQTEAEVRLKAQNQELLDRATIGRMHGNEVKGPDDFLTFLNDLSPDAKQEYIQKNSGEVEQNRRLSLIKMKQEAKTDDPNALASDKFASVAARGTAFDIHHAMPNEYYGEVIQPLRTKAIKNELQGLGTRNVTIDNQDDLEKMASTALKIIKAEGTYGKTNEHPEGMANIPPPPSIIAAHVGGGDLFGPSIKPISLQFPVGNRTVPIEEAKKYWDDILKNSPYKKG